MTGFRDPPDGNGSREPKPVESNSIPGAPGYRSGNGSVNESPAERESRRPGIADPISSLLQSAARWVLSMCRVEMIAHRGASHDAPENTLAAVRLAWEQGADAVEIDCRLTADDQIVVIHDPDTRRTAKESLQVHMHSLQDLQQLDVGRWKDRAFCGEQIPTLTDVIRTMPTGGRLFIEVKCGVEIVTTLADLLGRAEKPVDRFVVISYDRQVVAKMKQRLAEVTALLVCRCEPAGARVGTAAAIEDLIEIARCDRLDGLDLDARGLLDATTTAALTAAGLCCFSWTVDEPARARQLITAGVQGISTNRPGWLRDQLRSQPPSPAVD